MGHKNLNSKRLKRVEGDMYLAPPPSVLSRPETRSVPLRRCGNETSLGVCSSRTPFSSTSSNYEFSLEETVSEKNTNLSSIDVSDSLFNNKRGARARHLSEDAFHQNWLMNDKERQISMVPDSRSDSFPPSRPLERSDRSFSSYIDHDQIGLKSNRKLGILSTIYEDLQTPVLTRDTRAYTNYILPTTTTSSEHENEARAYISAQNTEPNSTAATIATDDIILRTATALGLSNEARTPLSQFSESDWNAQNERTSTAELSTTPSIDVDQELYEGVAQLPQTLGIDTAGDSALSLSSKDYLSGYKNLPEARTSQRTGTSTTITSSIRYGGGDSIINSPVTTSDWSSEKQLSEVYNFNSSPPPLPPVPPTSAATSTSDRPPFMLTFRRMKPRPRSIITNKTGKSSYQLMSTASMPEAMKSPTTHQPANSVTGNHAGLGNDVHQRVEQREPDVNNNEITADINNNQPPNEKMEEKQKSESKEKLEHLLSLDKKVVEGKAIVEVKIAETEVEGEEEEPEEVDDVDENKEPADYGLDPVDENFWNSDSTPQTQTQSERNGDGYYYNRSSYYKTEPYGKYSNSKYSTKYPYSAARDPQAESKNLTSETQSKGPFLMTEKGAIRFHLPGRIQHKTTIKVAHFPTGEDKNVTVNLKPDQCDADVDCCTANNQNFIAPPMPPIPTPYNPYAAAYGRYPYPSNYYGYYGYPPYY